MDPLKYFCLLFLSGCLCGCLGSQLPYSLAKPQISVNQMELKGTFTTSTGEVQSLENFKDQNVVVMFAQFFCEVCSREVEGILKSTSGAPLTKTKLISILVAADGQEAAQWKQLHKLTWTVGAMGQTETLKNYCPQGQTPCTVLYQPQRGVTFIKQGEVFAEELLNRIGSWE